jgi:hypothetical protein
VLHSPFVYKLYKTSIKKQKNIKSFETIEKLRQKLKNDNDKIAFDEIGAGSNFSRTKNMLVSEIAKKRFFDRDFRKIKIINERLEDISIDAKFDLIIVVGVVAHVQNTFMFLEKCKSFLAEEGILILQFTEASHFIVKYNNFIHKIFQRPRVRDHRWEELNIIFSELNLLIIKKIKFGFYPRGIKFMNGQTVFKIQKFLYNKKINFLLHDRMLILKNRGNS